MGLRPLCNMKFYSKVPGQKIHIDVFEGFTVQSITANRPPNGTNFDSQRIFYSELSGYCENWPQRCFHHTSSSQL